MMNGWIPRCSGLLIALLVLGLGMPGSATAGELDVQLSSTQAYVDAPLTLTITAAGSRVGAPELPDIDGLDIRGGAVQQNMQRIEIINGRQRVQQSTSWTFQIIPLREGEFEIPPIALSVDGESLSSDSLTFTAVASETGDLLEVEIRGFRERVYVGQMINVTLDIFVRPFEDPTRNLRLSEGDMWGLISDRTSWGPFGDRIEELRQRRERPGGKETMRPGADGSMVLTYHYEIDATIYGQQAETIDESEVRVVVDYPVAIQQVRDEMDRMFGNFFGRRRNSYSSVSQMRPIAATATMGAIEFLPVPTDGRPDSYRGAVGRYSLRTTASPRMVKAGDTIALNIGIVGTGPMELVQAPPLAKQRSLSRDFRVTDQPLAGIVQDDAKVFSAQIRPLREGISQIPPIEFSFFDPESESFETVRSEPITIEVGAAEVMPLDAIEMQTSDGPRRSFRDGTDNVPDAGTILDLDHPSALDLTRSILGGVSAGTDAPLLSRSTLLLWCTGLFVVLLGFWVARFRDCWSLWLDRWRPPVQAAADRLRSVDDVCGVEAVLDRYASRRLPAGENLAGRIRTAGLYGEAARWERLREQWALRADPPESLREATMRWLRDVDDRLTTRAGVRGRTPAKKPKPRAATTLLIGLIFSIGGAGSSMGAKTFAADPSSIDAEQITEQVRAALSAYDRGRVLTVDDPAAARRWLNQAARTYEDLLDRVGPSAAIATQLGNARELLGDRPAAIAAYRQALAWDGGSVAARQNLRVLEAQLPALLIDGSAATVKDESSGLLDSILAANESLHRSFLGRWVEIGFLVASAVVTVIAIGSIRIRRIAWPRTLASTGVIAIASGCSLVVGDGSDVRAAVATFVSNSVEVRGGDGVIFPVIVTFTQAAGHEATIIERREGWVRIKRAGAKVDWIGWVPENDVRMTGDGVVVDR